MQKVYAMGNLTRDPETSETSNGTAYCRFTIAVSRPADKNGNKGADFFNCLAWRNTATVCGRYLKKGSKLAVWGKFQSNNYEDKDGNKRQRWDLVVDEVEFLSYGDQSGNNNSEYPQEPAYTTKAKNGTQVSMYPAEEDDNLPF
jgi:single-strand DNA-binding protein